MRRMLALAVVILAGPAQAQDDGPIIDSLFANAVKLREALASATKQSKAADDAFRNALLDLRKKAKELGLDSDVPTPGPGPAPNPADPLTIKLRDAYRMETNPDKAKAMALVIELMRQSAALAKDETIPTTGKLAQVVGDVAKKLTKAEDGKTDRLPIVMAILRAEMAAVLNEDVAMTPTLRESAKLAFTRFQSSLEEAIK